MSQSNINQSSRSVTRGSLVGILTAVFALVIGLVGLPTTASQRHLIRSCRRT